MVAEGGVWSPSHRVWEQGAQPPVLSGRRGQGTRHSVSIDSACWSYLFARVAVKTDGVDVSSEIWRRESDMEVPAGLGP